MRAPKKLPVLTEDAGRRTIYAMINLKSTIKNFWHFSNAEYTARCNNLPIETLVALKETKNHQIMLLSGSMGATLVATVSFGTIPLLGCAISFRQIDVYKQQLNVIELAIREKEIAKQQAAWEREREKERERERDKPLTQSVVLLYGLPNGVTAAATQAIVKTQEAKAASEEEKSKPAVYEPITPLITPSGSLASLPTTSLSIPT
ncbi:hypothetical protein PIIN_06874 [Serendipita indica DSM 11827]|uniref:Uncharacterized protein n=1 Tax=Serendipita indica (strain DSM 11827) TaxID=1109443 RepID=G4TNP5_SERID|nr:hypothetical protein PIIN_06874 [Serendipita indica DSM 11827]